MTITQQAVTPVQTEIGKFSASLDKGCYISSDCLYFERDVKTELKGIIDASIVVYRVIDGCMINLNRVDYKYVYAQVDLSRQFVWFLGTRSDNKDGLSKSAREKLTVLTQKALLNHATANIETLRQKAKERLFNNIEQLLKEATEELAQRRQFIANLTR